MSDHSITSLIEKLEGAEVGSRELDALIYSHLNCTLIPRTDAKPRRRWPDGSVTLQRKVTTSLDAALALAERLWASVAVSTFMRPGEPSLASVLPVPNRDTYSNGKASTVPLAICAAILRAQSEARV